MTKYIGIGIGAGLVSALLFGVLLKATALAIVLYLLAPLPILIVGLGWSQRAGLVAAVTGALALSVAVSPYLGLGYLAYLALPAWWLAYLALLGRPRADGVMEWYPTGRLLTWTAATAALAFVAIAVIASPNYETFEGRLRGMTRSLVVLQGQMRGGTPQAPPTQPQAQPQTPPQLPQAQPPASAEAGGPTGTPSTDPGQNASEAQIEVANALATVAPGLAAQGLALLLTFYLWAAARIVQISGRLPRPWPDIPSTVMPRRALALFGLAFLLALVPGYPGMLGIALAGAMSAAFALQGLAAFHDRSRGRTARGAMLFGLYLILFATQGIALVALIVFGIADTALDRRRPRDEPGRT